MEAVIESEGAAVGTGAAYERGATGPDGAGAEGCGPGFDDGATTEAACIEAAPTIGFGAECRLLLCRWCEAEAPAVGAGHVRSGGDAGSAVTASSQVLDERMHLWSI